MILFIKNMVCLRCRMVVKTELEKLGLTCINVEPGKVEILETIKNDQLKALKTALAVAGLELISDKRNILIEQIKLRLYLYG